MILGIWDGHDSGAAIVENGKIIEAVNEERFTKRKLEVSFPENAVKYLLSKYRPDVAAFSTHDFSKTVSRIFPFIKERHYMIRRRKIRPKFIGLNKRMKILISNIPGNNLTKLASKSSIERKLKSLGFNGRVEMVGHHEAHAFTALQSGFRKSVVLTLDGVGDGLSGSLRIWNGNEMETLKEWEWWRSIAQFFEFVTYHLGFRELEDEGKVSALATYAYPTKNLFLDFFKIKGLDIIPKYKPMKLFSVIEEIAWKFPREEVAWMAQNAIEQWVSKLVENIIDETGIRKFSMAGGLFANIRLNMAVRERTGIRYFVFPHMGDGGLAAGAALASEGKSRRMKHAYLGPEFEIDERLFRENGLRWREVEKPHEEAAALINEGNYVLWFQGRMEYGPRALGNRSILAPANSPEIKDVLNLKVKKRQWFQPFCPSVLYEDSRKTFEGVKQQERFMTMGYRVKEKMVDAMKAVVSMDGVARPQMVGEENPLYRRLLKAVKREKGIGAVLNTSFNIHGKPIVMTPEDAVETMIKTGSRYMIIGNYLVES